MANPDNYYILYWGPSVTTIQTPVSAALGAGLNGGFSILRPSQQAAFFRIRAVPQNQPFDTDGDGVDDVSELLNPAQFNPLNPDDVLTRIRETSPASGEADVAVTRETILRFTRPLAASTVLTTNHLYAQFGAQRLLSRIELSSDRKTATLFYAPPMPASARIRVTFSGGGISDALGRPVDPDGDGVGGGVFTMDFETLGLIPVAGTAAAGRVFASELAPSGSTNESVNVPLAGVIITVDGREQDMRTATDQFGNFRLSPAPAGKFFVHIDGRTATNTIVPTEYPEGPYYPVVGKAWESFAGEEVLIGNIYLPLVTVGTLQTVSQNQQTTITFPQSVLQQHPELAGVSITVPPNSLYTDGGARGGSVGIAPVPADRLPSPLPPGVNPALVITVQTDGAANFDQPVPVCFPNLPDPISGELKPPGAKSALVSFNHDIGEWEIVGSMTVSADGRLVCTDPGVGIRQPGWHGTIDGSTGSGGDLYSGVEAESDSEKGGQHKPPACPCESGGCPKKEDEAVDPIYLFSGEFYEAVEDMRIPGRGPDFIWARKYRSKIGPNTLQGNGWDSSYNVLLEQRGQDLLLCDGNSRADIYPRRPDGTWSKKEFFRELIRNTNGTYTLTFEDKRPLEFHRLRWFTSRWETRQQRGPQRKSVPICL